MIFKQEELSETEQHLLVEIYNNPVVKKHLQMIAMNDTIELLKLSGIQTPNEVLAKAHATVQGKLAVIATLLSIEAPKSQPKE